METEYRNGLDSLTQEARATTINDPWQARATTINAPWIPNAAADGAAGAAPKPTVDPDVA